jgi:hypothetical protein
MKIMLIEMGRFGFTGDWQYIHNTWKRVLFTGIFTRNFICSVLWLFFNAKLRTKELIWIVQRKLRRLFTKLKQSHNFLWNSNDQNILIMTCQYVHHNLLSMRRISGGRGQNDISLIYTVPVVTFETGRWRNDVCILID